MNDNEWSPAWHYGPTDKDPDPGKVWCRTCGEEVYFFSEGSICSKDCPEMKLTTEQIAMLRKAHAHVLSAQVCMSSIFGGGSWGTYVDEQDCRAALEEIADQIKHILTDRE